VTYTVWIRDQQIGETRFELHPGPRRRAGSFHPTPFGLTILPGIVDMFPALLAFGQMCRDKGIDMDDESAETAAMAMDAFGGSPEGQRVLASARIISELHVRDGGGHLLLWESLAISDSSALARIANERNPALLAGLPSDSPDMVKYLITITLARHQPSRGDLPRPRLSEPALSS
jgi:hypothetical protein